MRLGLLLSVLQTIVVVVILVGCTAADDGLQSGRWNDARERGSPLDFDRFGDFDDQLGPNQDNEEEEEEEDFDEVDGVQEREQGEGEEEGSSPCDSSCTELWSRVTSSAFRAGDHITRLADICEAYQAADACEQARTSEIRGCVPDPASGGASLLPALHSGARYACVEQKDAFKAMIECIDAQASEVKFECSSTCDVQSKLMSFALKSGMMNELIGGGQNGAPGLMQSIPGGRGLMNAFMRNANPKVVATIRDAEWNTKEATTREKRQSTAVRDRELPPPRSVGVVQNSRTHVPPPSPAAVMTTTTATASTAFRPPSDDGEQRQAVVSGDAVAAAIPLLQSAFGAGAFPAAAGGAGAGVGSAGLPFLDLGTLRDATGLGCEIGECLLQCIRQTYNQRCKGPAGSLLSETFVRPIVRLMAPGDLASEMATQIFGLLLPSQCQFVTDHNQMAKHRISDAMDQEIHRAFDETGDVEVRGSESDSPIPSPSISNSSTDDDETSTPSDLDGNMNLPHGNHGILPAHKGGALHAAAAANAPSIVEEPAIAEEPTIATITEEEMKSSNDGQILHGLLSHPSSDTDFLLFQGDPRQLDRLVNETYFATTAAKPGKARVTAGQRKTTVAATTSAAVITTRKPRAKEPQTHQHQN